MTSPPRGKRPRYALVTPPHDSSDASSHSVTPRPRDGHGAADDARAYTRSILQHYAQLVTSSSASASAASAAPLAPSLDDLNARYRRLLKIGEGSFGQVYIVYDTVAHTYLVMKRMLRFLHTHRGRMLGLHNTTFRELHLLTTLRHPNILEVTDYHVLPDGTLVMFAPLIAHDLVAVLRRWRERPPPRGGGGGVRDGVVNNNNNGYGHNTLTSSSSSVAATAHTASQRMPLPAIKCIFRQLLHGVAYMHQHKVLHRDLKPSNVMVTEGGVVKLIDFGWARYLTPHVHKCAMTGPPCIVSYRPPEVLAGRGYATHYDTAVDVWCCGCLLFEMLSGGTPFVRAESEAHALRSIIDWLGEPAKTSRVYNNSRRSSSSSAAAVTLATTTAAATSDDKAATATRTDAAAANAARAAFVERCAVHNIRASEAAFLLRMLQLEPAQRASAQQLLQDAWFTTAPAACRPCELALPSHNTYRWLESRRRRLHL